MIFSSRSSYANRGETFLKEPRFIWFYLKNLIIHLFCLLLAPDYLFDDDDVMFMRPEAVPGQAGAERESVPSSGGGQLQVVQRVRKFFPETWLFTKAITGYTTLFMVPVNNVGITVTKQC